MSGQGLFIVNGPIEQVLFFMVMRYQCNGFSGQECTGGGHFIGNVTDFVLQKGWGRAKYAEIRQVINSLARKMWIIPSQFKLAMRKPLLTSLGCLLAAMCIAQNGAYEAERLSPFPYTSGYISQLAVQEEGYGKVSLSWSSEDTANDYFIIERSRNLQPFETVAVLHLAKHEKHVEWQDESPRQAGVVYRIKVIRKDGSQFLAGITTAPGNNGGSDFKVYPNPTQDILFVRAEFPSDITLLDANGKPRLVMPNLTGLHVVNLQALEKGVYIIRVYNRIMSTLSTERIIKN